MANYEEALKAMEVVIDYISKGNSDEHTKDTPARYLKAWENDWGKGYNYEMNFTTFLAENDDLVIERNIPVFSHCAHHLAPIKGVAHIAYIPDKRIVGLSKLNRTVEKYARRLQVQERLTSQIANYLMSKLQPKGVMVVIEAEHMCVSTRGVKHHNCLTTTSSIKGIFEEDDSLRKETLDLIRR